MQTLQELREGSLRGSIHLKLSENLKTFPVEIFDLADTLEILDLSGNELSSLPDDFGRLKKLRILFLSQNKFTSFPTVLSSCPHLEMIGFKSNQMVNIPEDSIPVFTRWLILTDNKIEALPVSIGKCTRLQKVMFAGNQLQHLPEEMARCRNIELLRISANQFETFPDWLFEMPRLSWLALAGNPIFQTQQHLHPTIDWNHLTMGEKLGEGTSGNVFKAMWNRVDQPPVDVVVKVYKNNFSSDGWTDDEMVASMSITAHPHLIHGLGYIPNHPERKKAMVLLAVPARFQALGLTPTFASCTRDVFESGKSYTASQIQTMAQQMASAACHLHFHHINHGDLYAHNTLVDPLKQHIYLGDYGAACKYEALPKHQAERLEKIEVRSWGSFVDDLLTILSTDDDGSENLLKQWRNMCFQEDVISRPSFQELVDKISPGSSQHSS